MLTLHLARGGAQVTGLDTDPRMLAAARGRLRDADAKAQLVHGDVQALPFEADTFDLVVAVTVLCLVPDPRLAVGEMVRVLKPGGRLVVGELGRHSLWAAIRRVRGWLGSATWNAARFWSRAELRHLAETSGLDVAAVRGAIFYPPVGWLASPAGGADSWLGRRATFGAAFIALAAVRPPLCDETPGARAS